MFVVSLLKHCFESGFGVGPIACGLLLRKGSPANAELTQMPRAIAPAQAIARTVCLELNICLPSDAKGVFVIVNSLNGIYCKLETTELKSQTIGSGQKKCEICLIFPGC